MLKGGNWLQNLVKEPATVILLIGALLIWSALGETKIGDRFEFGIDKELPKEVRIGVAILGAMLALSGAAALLYRAFRPPAAPEKGFIGSLSWDAHVDSFKVEFSSAELADIWKAHKLLLICRKRDHTIHFSDDLRIQKSRYFPIEGEHKSMMVEFPPEFSSTLKPGDWVECAI